MKVQQFITRVDEQLKVIKIKVGELQASRDYSYEYCIEGKEEVEELIGSLQGYIKAGKDLLS